MKGARKGPRMSEDAVGPRHSVVGGPIGIRRRRRDQEESVAIAAQQPQENEKTRDAGSWLCRVTGLSKGEGYVGLQTTE